MTKFVLLCLLRRQIQKVALHHQTGGEDEGGGGAAGAVTQVSFCSAALPPPLELLNKPVIS